MPRPLLRPLLSGLLLAVLGCTPHGDCGCTPPPSGTAQGRLVDAQGQPVAGAEVCVVTMTGSDPVHQGLYVEAKGSSRADGTFDLPAVVGRHRILVRARVGGTVFLPRLGPEFELKAAGTLVAGPDLDLTAAVPATLTVAITPVHGAQQEDALLLEQRLQADGIEFTLPIASLKPAIVAGIESVVFASQPPGTYALSLWRSETTGTHANVGSAKATLTLAEGAALDLPLPVQ
ncbi:MAG: carboxypeptidase regulatory-like domain-containing protein [Geothrix sp.]|uniref:carboxypeptidase-like regulatory domain-containing protein n=1 Tax=Geothrix sp. TaxID=1962974 RepID=UPI00185A217F|nr:carboxypeptidase-like regulatory domain-containing protein [Geothrix sp.]NWJ40632.1 carboxypeptidase regulatory-like domain-containing protein [Geothrix sp.]WIL21359.1 MAG: carboxypeptidase-like regulatory domain-containing protein [Geothrix sp.]